MANDFELQAAFIEIKGLRDNFRKTRDCFLRNARLFDSMQWMGANANVLNLPQKTLTAIKNCDFYFAKMQADLSAMQKAAGVYFESMRMRAPQWQSEIENENRLLLEKFELENQKNHAGVDFGDFLENANAYCADNQSAALNARAAANDKKQRENDFAAPLCAIKADLRAARLLSTRAKKALHAAQCKGKKVQFVLNSAIASVEKAAGFMRKMRGILTKMKGEQYEI